MICLSNDTTRVASCYVHGHHLDDCTGTRRSGAPCRGCLPRPAERGLLCRDCCDKADEALELAPDFIPHLRSIERAGTPDRMGISTGKPTSHVIIPTSWITADALWQQLTRVAIAHAKFHGEYEPTQFHGMTTMWGFGAEATIDEVTRDVRKLVGWVVKRLPLIVAREEPTRELLLLIAEFQRALHAFPLDEKARPVRYARCRECDMRTLEYRPPLDYLTPIVIRCTNSTCGAEFDPAMVAWDLRRLRERILAARAQNSTRTEAAP